MFFWVGSSTETNILKSLIYAVRLFIRVVLVMFYGKTPTPLCHMDQLALQARFDKETQLCVRVCA